MKTLHESDNKLTLKQLQAKGNQVRVRKWVAAYQCGERTRVWEQHPKDSFQKKALY